MNVGLYAVLFGPNIFGAYMLVDTSTLPDSVIDDIYRKAGATGLLPGDPRWQASNWPECDYFVGLLIESWDTQPIYAA